MRCCGVVTSGGVRARTPCGPAPCTCLRCFSRRCRYELQFRYGSIGWSVGAVSGSRGLRGVRPGSSKSRALGVSPRGCGFVSHPEQRGVDLSFFLRGEARAQGMAMPSCAHGACPKQQLPHVQWHLSNHTPPRSLSPSPPRPVSTRCWATLRRCVRPTPSAACWPASVTAPSR